MSEWRQYDSKHFFDDFKTKQSTTKLKIVICKIIDLTFNLKKILALKSLPNTINKAQSVGSC